MYNNILYYLKKVAEKRKKLQGLGKLPCGAKVICHLPAVGTCKISRISSMQNRVFFPVFPQVNTSHFHQRVGILRDSLAIDND